MRFEHFIQTALFQDLGTWNEVVKRKVIPQLLFQDHATSKEEPSMQFLQWTLDLCLKLC